MAMKNILKFTLDDDFWPSGDAIYLGSTNDTPPDVSRKLSIPILWDESLYYFVLYIEEIGMFALFASNIDEGMTLAVDQLIDPFRAARLIDARFSGILKFEWPGGKLPTRAEVS